MISSKLLVVLIIGTIAMLTQMVCRRKNYKIPFWKLSIISILLTVAGTVGALLMYFIENGSFGGRSFFGALLFIPLLMFPVGLIFKITFGKLMDLCAPAECIMLAILKVDCVINNCCYGRILYYTDTGVGVRFPSQIVEMIVILIIMCCLIIWEKMPGNSNTIYPIYMILYGATRFILNWMRGDITPFVWILPAGSFWALCSVALGVLILLYMNWAKKHINK